MPIFVGVSWWCGVKCECGRRKCEFSLPITISSLWSSPLALHIEIYTASHGFQHSRRQHGSCIQIGPVNLPAKFEVRSFTGSWDKRVAKLQTPISRNGGHRRSGMVSFERALVSSYTEALHSNFSSIFTHFWNIATFVLQNTIFPYPTSSLPQISPMFPGSRWIAFWLQRAKVLGVIDRTISFQDFQPMWSQITDVIDGRTDRRTTCAVKSLTTLNLARDMSFGQFKFKFKFKWSSII